MATRKILSVELKRKGKAWSLTLAGSEREMLEYMVLAVQKCAELHKATVFGSNPLGDLITISRQKSRKSRREEGAHLISDETKELEI